MIVHVPLSTSGKKQNNASFSVQYIFLIYTVRVSPFTVYIHIFLYSLQYIYSFILVLALY